MPTKYPLQVVTGYNLGINQTSQALVGEILPACGFTQAGLRQYYNTSNNNTVLLEAAASFPHSSGVETLGYAFNSNSDTPWKFRVSSLAVASDGKSAHLLTDDGGTIEFTKSGDTFYETVDFGIGRSQIAYDSDRKCWIRYNPATEMRHVYNMQGQLVAKYRDGLGMTTYSYDSSNRLTKIIPPGSHHADRNYSISYKTNAGGTETQTISVSDSGKTVPLREYLFSKDKLIEKITVLAQGTDASSGSDMPYVVDLTYRQKADHHWGLESIATDNDASSLHCVYGTDSTLTDVQLGSDTPYAIRFDYSQKSKGITKVNVSSGMQVEITQSSFGVVTQVANYTGYDKFGAPDLTLYEYEQARVTKKTTPDGVSTTYAYADDTDLDHGLLIKQTRGDQVIVTDYEVIQGRIYKSAVTTSCGTGVNAKTDYYVHKSIQQRPHYKSDYCVGLAYAVSRDSRVTGFDLDPLTGLASYVRSFPAATYTDDVSVDKLDTWANDQYKNKAFTLTQLQCLSGSTQIAATGSFSKLTTDGYAIPNDQYALDTSAYDILMQKTQTTKTLSYTKDGSGSSYPVIHDKQYGYDSFGHMSDMHYDEDQIDEVNFWQKQEVGSATMRIQQSAQYQYNKDASSSVVKIVTQPNGRQDVTSCNEHAWPVAVDSTDIQGVVRSSFTVYDAAGRPAHHTSTTGKKWWSVYGNQNKLGFHVDSSGYVTQHLHDQVNRYHQVIHYANPIDLTGVKDTLQGSYILKLLKPDASNDRSNYAFFDDRGNQIYAVDEENNAVETRYNLFNKPTAQIDYKKPITADQLTALMSKQDPKLGGPDDTTVIGPATADLYDVTSNYYDGDSNLVFSLDADGWAHEITYDSADNPIITRRCAAAYVGTRPQFQAPTIAKADGDIYSLEYYDTRGRSILSVDGDGYVTAKEYDAGSREIKRTRFYTPLNVDDLLSDATHACPQNPAANPQDHVTNIMHNTQGGVIATQDSAQLGTWTVTDEMGQTLAHAQYDLSQPDKIQSGDAVRAVHTQYSAWKEVVAKTNPWVDPELLSILADSSLTPDERNQQVTDFWSNKSIRTAYDNGLLMKTFNTLHTGDETDENAGATIYYYNDLDQLVFVIDSEGGIKQQTYNQFGENTETRSYVNSMDTASGNYQKLLGGLLTSDVQQLLTGYQDEQDVIIAQNHDKRGLVVLKTDGEGYQTRTTYDFKARKIMVEKSRTANDSFDVVVVQSFDGRDNVIGSATADSAKMLSVSQSWEFDHPLDKMTAHTNAVGLKTTYRRGKRGLQLEIGNEGTNAGSDAITYTYDASGRVLTHTNKLDEVIKHAYDQASCTHTVTMPDGSSTKVMGNNVFADQVSEAEGDNDVSWTHDGAGNNATHTNAIGATESTERNSEGVIVQKTDFLGRINQWERNNLGQTTQFSEDINGRDLKTQYQRDGLNRVIELTNARGVVSNTTFSKNSQPLVVVLDPGTDTDPGLKQTTTKTFDGLNNCLTQVESAAADSATYHLKFDQDDIGRPTQKTIDPDGLALAKIDTLNAAAKVVVSTDAKGGKSYTFINVYGLKVFVISADGLCTEHGYDGLNREVVKYVYAGKLPSSILGQLTADISVEDASTLLSPYRGGTDSCQAFASEIRTFYDANGSALYSVKVLRTDPSQPGTGSACITQNYRDADRRLIKCMTYSTPMQWTTEPDWTNATVAAAIKPDSSNDRTYHFVLDAAGDQRFTVDPTGLVTEKSYRADCEPWLIVKYANPVTDMATLAGISLADMTTLVESLADSNLDRINGGFKNNHDKPVYAFNTYAGTTVSLVKFVYDGCDNQTSEVKFAAAVDVSSRDPDVVLAAFDALTPDSTLDSVKTSVFLNNNALQDTTDALGNKDSYTRSALKLALTHTDRNGNAESFGYDAAKRCSKEISPEMPVTTTVQAADAKGNLTLTASTTTRAVETDKVYDAINNVTQIVRDSGGANLTLNTTYGYSKQAIETTQDDVEIDDSSVVDASLASFPTKSVTISKASYSNGLELPTIELRNSIPLKAYIYDSAGRQRYLLKFESADFSNVSVIETRYNSFGDQIWKIEYANPLVLSGSWDQDWFVSMPIQFLSQIGSVTASAQDRVTYTALDLAGRPVETYKGLDIDNCSPDEGKFTGLVPYLAPLAESDSDTSPSVGYSETKRTFLGGRVTREARLIDLQAGRWSDDLVWYMQSETLREAARAVPTRASFGDSDMVCVVTRNTYCPRGLKVSVTKYATLMSFADLEKIDNLTDLDAYLEKNTHDKDRMKEFGYDLNGNAIKITYKNVTRHALVMPITAGEGPSVNEITGDLCRDIKRNGTGDIIGNSQLYFTTGAVVRNQQGQVLRVIKETDDVAWEYFILDARGKPVAQVSLPVNQGDTILYPLRETGYDALGNTTQVCCYQQGADATSIGVGLTPKAKSPSADTDPVTLSLYNKRKKKTITVDAKGYARLSTFDEMDKPARDYHGYTPTKYDSTTDTYADDTTVVEQTMYNNDRRGRLLSKMLYRAGVLQSADYLQYNQFGEDVAMGDDESDPQLKKIYDVLGGLRVTNSMQIRGQQGIACARQLDLAGRLTQEVEATTTDLMQTTVADLGQADFYTPDDLQLTTFYPAEGKGNVLKQLLPATTAGEHLQATPVPVEMSTQVFSGDYGSSTLVPLLRWPKASIDNATLTIVLTDSTGKKYTDLTVVEEDLYREVDVSALPTDVYSYEMDYAIHNVVTDKDQLFYQSSGSAPIVTAQAPTAGSGVVVSFMRDDSTLYFAGDISDYSKVNLYDSTGTTLITALTLTTDATTGYKLADGSALTSATYVPKLVDSAGKELAKDLAPAVVNTLVAPTESQSWAVPATATLSVTDDQTSGDPTVGTLAIWATLPPAMRACDVSLSCDYVDTDDAKQTQTVSLTPSDLTAEFDFDKPVKSVSTMTLSLTLDATNSIKFYATAAPDSSTDLTFTFAARRYCLMRGADFVNQGDTFAIQYKDTSKGQKSTWVDMSGSGIPMGVLFDVNAFANSNYPFVKAGGDTGNPPYVFTVSRGAMVVSSDSQVCRLQLRDKTRPSRLFEYDAFSNRTQLTDASDNVFGYEYNDLDKQTTKTDPKVVVYDPDDKYNLIEGQPVTKMYYDTQSSYIAREYPSGGIEAIERDVSGNLLQVTDADGVSLVANQMNGLSQLDKYTRLGSVNTLTHDLNGNQTGHSVPNASPGAYGTSEVVVTQDFNEKNKLKQMTDGAGNSTRYNWDSWDNITTRWTPLNHRYDQEFYIKMMQKRTRPDGLTEIWSASKSLLKYVGVWDSYTDLGGTVTNLAFNQRLQKITQKSGDVSTDRGNYTRATPYTSEGWFGFAYVSYSLDTEAQVKQDITFGWDVNNLTSITDTAMGQLTENDFDLEGRQNYTRLSRTVDSASRQGYVRHAVAADGDCGLTAFGVTREDALSLLQDHVDSIQDLLKPALQEALLTDKFYRYLLANDVINNTVPHTKLVFNFPKLTSQELSALYRQYLIYDVRDKAIDAGFAHPGVLQALAHIRGVSLRMWVLGEAGELKPHRGPGYDYTAYMSPRAERPRPVDLLFVRGNHFELLHCVNPRRRVVVGELSSAAYRLASTAGSTVDSVIHEAASDLDALGRPVMQFDNIMGVSETFDLNGSLIRRVGSQNDEVKSDDFFTYTAARRILIANGMLDDTNKVVVTTASQGMLCGYDDDSGNMSDLRTSETYYDKTKNTYQYNTPDGRISQMTTYDGKTATFWYDDARLLREQDGPDENTTSTFDGEYVLTYQHNDKSNGDWSTTSFVHNSAGDTTSQSTHSHIQSASLGYGKSLDVDYSFDYNLGYFGSRSIVRSINAYTSDKYGTKWTSSAATVDPNGNPNTMIGSNQGQGDDYSPNTIFMTVGNDSLIRSKTTFPQEISSATTVVRYTSSNESLFYSANNGNYFGEYTTQGYNLVVGGHLSKPGNTGLREVLTTKSAKMGELALSDLAAKQSSLPGHRHGHRSFFEAVKWGIGRQSAKTMDTDPNNEQVHHYIQSIKDMKPWNHQQSMVVGSGDTFESIARNFAGSANAALDVALENGFSGDALITQRKIVRRAVSSVAFLRYSKLLCGDAIKGARSLVLAARHVLPSVFMGGNPRYIPLAEPIASDDWQTWELVKKLREKLAEAADNPLTVGQVIMLPQYTPSTYTASSATPLSALTGEIEGSFLPHLVWAQKHHHFWQVFFRILILLTDMVVSVAAATFGPYLDALITAATDAVMQGLYYEMGLIDDFSWEEVIGAGISGATAGIGGVDKIMTAASHLESIAVVAEAVGIVVAENVAQQLAEMATGLRKHFSMRELLVSAATFMVNAVANTSLSLNQSGILNSVERSLVDAGLDELTGSAIMGRNPSLESALDQFGMNLGSNLLSGMVEEIKEATKEGEKATARASKQTSMYKPVDALSAGKKAWWDVWAQTNYQAAADHDSQSLNNAAQAHNTVNAKDFNYGDWYKDTLGIAKAESHFNKSEAAGGFINPANDFTGYMNMLTSQSVPAPQYHNYVEASPTSAQPKAVVGGGFTRFIYNHQNDPLGQFLLGTVEIMSSHVVSNMAAGADKVANFAKPMNPIIMGYNTIMGKDMYTGLPVSRLEAATAFAFDVAGGEIFSFAGKGLSMVLAPGANASLGSVLMMGAKLQLGNLLESELATTVFSGVDSALIQPIKGLGQRVGVFGGGREINQAAHNAADALRLNTTLALQDAKLLDQTGNLTDYAISRAQPALSRGSVLRNPGVVSELTQSGSEIEDWSKMKTPSAELPSGQRVQIHFYQNKVTGEISYNIDFKVKGQVHSFPKSSISEPTVPPYSP